MEEPKPQRKLPQGKRAKKPAVTPQDAARIARDTAQHAHPSREPNLPDADSVLVDLLVRREKDTAYGRPIQAEPWLAALKGKLRGRPLQLGLQSEVEFPQRGSARFTVVSITPSSPGLVHEKTRFRVTAPADGPPTSPEPDRKQSSTVQASVGISARPTLTVSGPFPTHAFFQNDRARGEDLLGREREYRALAQLAAAWQLEPPLAIGVFGDWGSGKTFFMERMRAEVERLSREARAMDRAQRRVPYCKRVAQVWFNAWHYQGSDLWAGLVDHIFNNLSFEKGESANLLEARRRQLLKDLEVAKSLEKKASAEAAAAKTRADVARDAVHEAERDLQRALRRPPTWLIDESMLDLLKLAGVKDPVGTTKRIQDRVDRISTAVGGATPALKEMLEQPVLPSVEELEAGGVKNPGGVRQEAVALRKELDDASQKLEALHAQASQARGILGPLAFGMTRGRPSGRGLVVLLLALVLSALAAFFAGTAGLLPFGLGAIDAVVSIPLVTGAGTVLYRGLRWAHGTQQRLAAHHERATREHQAALVVGQAELATRQAALATALEAEQSAAARVQRIQGDLDKLGPGQLLAEFIQDRASSGDYRKHLGILAQVRNDFDRLAEHFELLREAERNGKEDAFFRQHRVEGRTAAPAGSDGDPPEEPTEAVHAVNRIILYIDDLDRCRPARVVEVLEAVHLLLAFPLFVVVVGVDGRWVTKALRRRYPELLEAEDREDSAQGPRDATPYDYLEKIFQIPIWLRTPLPEDAQQIVTGYLREEASAATLPEDRDSSGLDHRGPDQPPQDEDPVGRQPASGGALVRVSSSGAKAAAGGPLPDPRPLLFSDEEKVFLGSLAPAVGRSPRTIKRFINSYRVLKTTLAPPEDPLWGAIGGRPSPRETMFLLAVVTGQPEFVTPFSAALARGHDEEIRSVVDEVSRFFAKGAPGDHAHQERWETLGEFLLLQVARPDDPQQATRLDWEFRRVQRFAFNPPPLRAALYWPKPEDATSEERGTPATTDQSNRPRVLR